MQTVFITGVSKGIGKALTQLFLTKGHTVYGTSLNGTLDYAHEKLVPMQLDITNDEQNKNVTARLQKEEVVLDVLINNAGVLLGDNDDTVDLVRLQKTLDVNLFGTIKATQALLPFVKNDGHIVNISSSAGQLEREHTSARYPGYKISKTALNMYTVCLAERLKARGTTVSAVHPGWAKTDMGGEDAEITPQEAAQGIYDFTQQKHIATGKFWHKGAPMQW